MAASISRRKLAAYAAAQLAAGTNKTAVLSEVAAYLIEQRRTQQVELLVRDVYAILARDHGHVVADVTAARELSDGLVESITKFVKIQENAQAVEVNTSIDPSLLGGVVIKTPSAELDTSIRTKLNALRA